MASFGDLSRINGNIQALQALNSLYKINGQLGTHQLRLATGKRINSAEDDAAGFVIGRTMQARTKGLAVSLANVGDAKSMLSVAEGGLESILDILETMKEKTTQAASDTLGTTERAAIESELDALAAEIDDIVDETSFNGVGLLSSVSKTIQTGEATTDTLSVTVTGSGHKGSLAGCCRCQYCCGYFSQCFHSFRPYKQCHEHCEEQHFFHRFISITSFN
jgi:flagellin